MHHPRAQRSGNTDRSDSAEEDVPGEDRDDRLDRRDQQDRHDQQAGEEGQGEGGAPTSDDDDTRFWTNGGGLGKPDATVRPAQARKTEEVFTVVDGYNNRTVCVFLLQNKQSHANQLYKRYKDRYGDRRRCICIHSSAANRGASTSADALLGACLVSRTCNDVITLVNAIQLRKIRDFIKCLIESGRANVHIFVDEADVTFIPVVRAFSSLPRDVQSSPRLRATWITATLPADTHDDSAPRSCVWKYVYCTN